MSIIIENIQRPTSKLIERFKKVSPCELGHELEFGFVSSELRPFIEKLHFAGPALTVRIPPNDSTMVYKALDLAKPGDVIVVDMQGETRHACWGEVTTLTAINKGLVGAIIDGPITDKNEIKKMNFPVFARCTSALTTKLLGYGGDINIPIQCGGVPVNPGDVVLANENGVLVIPLNLAEDLIKLAEKAEEKDLIRKKRIKAKEPILEIMGINKIIEGMKIKKTN
jgi:regulator of RNase E activity RraA